MNGGNRERGQADGFGLEILPKLKDVKGKVDSPTPTLLHYIVHVYIDKYVAKNKITSYAEDNIPLPVPEPQDLEKASLVDFEEIEAELKRLRNEIGMVERKIMSVIENAPSNGSPKSPKTPDSKVSSESNLIEPFKSRMESFVSKARSLLENQNENLKETRGKFPETMEFFTYKPKSRTESEQVKEFFGHWLPFCSDFKDIFKNEKASRLRQE